MRERRRREEGEGREGRRREERYEYTSNEINTHIKMIQSGRERIQSEIEVKSRMKWNQRREGTKEGERSRGKGRDEVKQRIERMV